MRSISSSSVYLIDVKNPAAPQVERVLKPGLLVGQVEGGTAACSGSHPHSVVETRRAIFVANGNNDTINVFDRSSLRRLHDIELAPSFGPKLPGSVAVTSWRAPSRCRKVYGTSRNRLESPCLRARNRAPAERLGW